MPIIVKQPVFQSLDRLGKHFQRCLSQMKVTREGGIGEERERERERVCELEKER